MQECLGLVDYDDLWVTGVNLQQYACKGLHPIAHGFKRTGMPHPIYDVLLKRPLARRPCLSEANREVMVESRINARIEPERLINDVLPSCARRVVHKDARERSRRLF